MFLLYFCQISSKFIHFAFILSINYYYDGNEIVFDLTLIQNPTDIKIVDILGRTILEKTISGKTVHYIPITNKNQVYIVNAVSNDASLVSKIFVY